MKPDTRNRSAGVILAFCFILIFPVPGLLADDSVNLSNKAFERLGLTISCLFECLGNAGINAGRGNFVASFDKPKFSRDYRKMRLQITG